MLNEQIVKDVAEIHARLLDHRPVLQGHVSYFIKEFEEKRGQQEYNNLSKTVKNVQQVKDVLLPECTDAMQVYLSNVIAKLKVAREVCNKIEEKENNVAIEVLVKDRGVRNKEWEDYMNGQKENCAKFDVECEEQIQTLHRHYDELEDKVLKTTKII